ncbi:hypothetical protein ACQJBY_025597 [Aegilops geniculata]
MPLPPCSPLLPPHPCSPTSPPPPPCFRPAAPCRCLVSLRPPPAEEREDSVFLEKTAQRPTPALLPHVPVVDHLLAVDHEASTLHGGFRPEQWEARVPLFHFQAGALRDFTDIDYISPDHYVAAPTIPPESKVSIKYGWGGV